jgi:hypothetical protein
MEGRPTAAERSQLLRMRPELVALDFIRVELRLVEVTVPL